MSNKPARKQTDDRLAPFREKVAALKAAMRLLAEEFNKLPEDLQELVVKTSEDIK